MYSLGLGGWGQLGLGDIWRRMLSPECVAELQDKWVLCVEVGENHSCAITDTNALFTWGKGDNWQLGQGDSKGRSLPKQVHFEKRFVLHVSAGSEHTLVELDDNSVWQFGYARRMLQGAENTYIVIAGPGKPVAAPNIRVRCPWSRMRGPNPDASEASEAGDSNSESDDTVFGWAMKKFRWV